MSHVYEYRMGNYVYGTVGMEELAKKSETDLRLPRYQRPKGKWTEEQQLLLSLSVFLDLPSGYISWKETEDGPSMLIDGRQRREAIRRMLNPLSFALIIEKATKSVKVEGEPAKEWSERIFTLAKDWLKSYDEEGFISTYKDKTAYPDVAALKTECDQRGLDGGGSREDMEKRLAKSDMETGLGLDKKYQDSLSPLVKFVTAVRRENKTVLAGFKEIYGKNNKELRKLWGLNEEGPSDGDNRPKFWKWEANRAGKYSWVFDPEIFSSDMAGFFADAGYADTRCKDSRELVDWLGGKYSSILTSDYSDKVKLTEKWIGETHILNGHEEIVNTFLPLRYKIAKTSIGLCKLTDSCTITEAMKVFQLINSAGVQLSEIEVMASWPDWGFAFVHDSDNPADSIVRETVEEMYQGKKSMSTVDLDNISKWDIAATVTARLDHTIIWGS